MIYQSIINIINTTNLYIEKNTHTRDQDKLHCIHTKDIYIAMTRTIYSSITHGYAPNKTQVNTPPATLLYKRIYQNIENEDEDEEEKKLR